jgi:hypothetical protein
MAVTIIDRINNVWTAAKNAWFGVDSPPSFLNPLYVEVGPSVEKRILKYQLFWDYYDGNHKKYLKNNEHNVTINYSAKIVDKGVSFLFGKPLKIELNDATITDKELYLSKVFYSDEQMHELFIDMATTGGVCGDFFLQMWVDDQGIPHFDNLNPSLVYPKYRNNNYKDVISYEIRWIDNDTVYRNRHERLSDGTWYSFVEYQDENQRYWISDEELSYAWPYQFPAILGGKNLPNPKSSFGKSDIESADLNDSINFVASNVNKTVNMFATPILWGKGFDTEKFDISEFNTSTDENATIQAVEIGKTVGSNTDYLNFLKGAYAETTSVPENDPENLRVGSTSGFALQVLLNDLLLKTGVKRSLYGSAIKEMCHRALIIGGYDGQDNTVKLHWSNPLPIDERTQVENDRFDLEQGIASLKTIRAKRGYDYAIEEERINLEKGNANESKQV